MTIQYRRTGYLKEDFRLFHNVDTLKKDIPFHYHDFHKILMLLSGNITYLIEGKQYTLQPYDIVLVGAGQIHRPIVHDHSPYERIIFYISSDFFHREENLNLNIFSQGALASPPEAHKSNASPTTPPEVHKNNASLIRLENRNNTYFRSLQLLSMQLKEAAYDHDYACEQMRNARFIEFLVLLNRMLRNQDSMISAETTSNPLILQAIDYIHTHLTEDTLDIDSIARAVSLDRSYLMHLFKAQIGYTIGQYVKEKRLYMADTLIQSGTPITQACLNCGFKNYAAFYYAYRQKHAASPLSKTPQEMPLNEIGE